jgi:hypothetical protein
MKKLLFGVIATVMVSGLLLGSMGSDAFALSSQGADKGEAKGCDNGKAKNNPHCGTDQCDITQTYYFDGDGDGLGAGAGFSCEQLSNNTTGYVPNNNDCDDTDPTNALC